MRRRVLRRSIFGGGGLVGSGGIVDFLRRSWGGEGIYVLCGNGADGWERIGLMGIRGSFIGCPCPYTSGSCEGEKAVFGQQTGFAAWKVSRSGS